MRNRPVAIIDMLLLKWQEFIISVGGAVPVLKRVLFMRLFVCLQLLEECGRTACHPMGTTTTAYLWSMLAAALPNGIFLEITAYVWHWCMCFLPLLLIVCTIGIILCSMCVSVCACMFVCFWGGGGNSWAEVHWEHAPLSHGAGWNMTQWLQGNLPGKL